MVKIVESGCRDCTVTLDGTECAVEFPANYRVFSAKNMSDNDIIMSVESGKTAADDGVRIVEAGGVGALNHMRSDINTVYITGTGKVQISAGNEAVLPFKAAEKGGDTVSASGNPVQLSGRQGGVPFADISLSAKNLFDYSMSAIPNGIIVTTLTDGSINVSGKMERETAWGINLILKNPLPKGKTYTLSINPDVIGILPINVYYIGNAKENQTFIWNRDENFTVSLNIQPNVDYDFVFRPQLELGDTATAYEPPITGRELTVNVNGADYTITPDSNPYTIPDDIRQQDGYNVITASAGELSVTGSLKNSTLKKVWDKLDELATAIIVSNGEI